MPPEQAIAAACDHLKTIMTAVHAYSADHGGKFPPVAIPNRNLAEAKQQPGLVLLLPYLGEKPKGLSDEAWQRYGNRVDEAAMQKAKELYGKIDRTKAWDDPANAEAAKTIVPTFLAPSSAANSRQQRAGGIALRVDTRLCPATIPACSALPGRGPSRNH